MFGRTQSRCVFRGRYSYRFRRLLYHYTAATHESAVFRDKVVYIGRLGKTKRLDSDRNHCRVFDNKLEAGGSSV